MHGGDVVAVEQVGVLQAHAQAGAPGGVGAGVVERGEHTPGLVVFDLDFGVDFVFFGRRAQHHARLLDRALVGRAQIVGERARVGRLAFFQRRQAAADVLVTEVGVAADLDFANARFDYAQNHNAAFERLLRKEHLHGAETSLPVRAFEGFERALHIGKITLLALVRGEHRLDLLWLEECVAFDAIGRNVKAQRHRIRSDRRRRRE